ncbi:hypothetical protein ABZ949_02630 [Micromonospora tulbaghiae]|uniref:hypothetical protein n=1 Tax=Micromonospora tulbaghiae TaxID=479978 RepID=UPI003403B077
MNRAEIARAITACETMAKQLRDALTADAEAEYREQGTVPTWRLPGITVTGATTNPTVVISDEAAFLAWVADRYPSEVEQITTTRIRPAWQQQFLKGVIARGEPACDEQGEEIPGLTWRAGGGFGGISLRVDADTKALIRDHARQIVAGQIPLALPGEASA